MASFTERYHELTKYNPHTIDKMGEVHWKDQPVPFKDLPIGEQIDLVAALKIFFDQFDSESSSFPADKPDPTKLETLARLLYFTLGLTARMKDSAGNDFFFRAAPSAGGLYPAEIYVAAKGIDQVPDGLYHYHSMRACLIPVLQGDFTAEIRHHFLNHPAAGQSPITFIFTGMYGRSAWRYRERAYRRILLDTGHAIANTLEVCAHMKLDFAVLGSFEDQSLEELLFLSAKEEFPLLGIAIGPAHSLPILLGQNPSLIPEAAVRNIDRSDPMQVQQNTCERIHPQGELRARVSSSHHPVAFKGKDFDPQPKILQRRSCRRFMDHPIHTDHAGSMLAYAFRNLGDTVPESGLKWSLAPGMLDIHIVALRIDEREAGVYHYDPVSTNWTLTKKGDFGNRLQEICLGQELGGDCAFALIYSCDMDRLAKTYGDRGYRYACLDAGQIGERLNIIAMELALGSSGIGGYYDDLANELLDLPLAHGILYISLVGVPEE